MSFTRNADLQVERISDALSGRTLDVVVAGSIGAVESVKFIRSLRRLGAEVQPWLTAGGAQFVTATALAWAAGRPVREGFSGDASHVAENDACILAPVSASLIGRVAHGLTDTPAAALVASYLGEGKTVMMVPNMHDSLANAPAVRRNLETLKAFGVRALPTRDEEGKRKFPEGAGLADEVAHVLNRARVDGTSVLLTMGSTRGYIDAVRYVSNYSSGKLGSLMAEELYRRGFAVDVVAGPAQVTPKVYGSLTAVKTNDEMAEAARRSLRSGAKAAILAASVLDFTPEAMAEGKIRSAEHDQLHVVLKRTGKIIADLAPASGVKVAFKLELGLTPETAREWAERYMEKYQLTLMVLNDLADVDETRHKATVFERGADGRPGAPVHTTTKAALAQVIVRHVEARLTSGEAAVKQ